MITKDFNIGLEGNFFLTPESNIEDLNLIKFIELLSTKTNFEIDNFKIFKTNTKKKEFKNQVLITIFNKLSDENEHYQFKFFKNFSFQLSGLSSIEIGEKIISLIIKFINSFKELNFKLEEKYNFKVNMFNKTLSINFKIDTYQFYNFLIMKKKISNLECFYGSSFTSGLFLYILYDASKIKDKISLSKEKGIKDEIQLSIQFQRKGTIIIFGTFIPEIQKEILNYIIDLINDYIKDCFNI